MPAESIGYRRAAGNGNHSETRPTPNRETIPPDVSTVVQVLGQWSYGRGTSIDQLWRYTQEWLGVIFRSPTLSTDGCRSRRHTRRTISSPGTWQSLQSGNAFLLLAQFALYFRRAHECSHQVGSHGVGDSAGERKVKAAFREAATGNREPARWLCCSSFDSYR